MLSRFHKSNKKENKNKVQEQFVVFNVGQEEFGVGIKQTREIINVSELTSIPNAPDFVRGVINLRGEIVPVVDLITRLSLSNSSYEMEEDKIIIVEFDESLIGMLVNDVKEIIRLNVDDINEAPKITRGINKDFIRGVGKLKDRLLILLNLKQILSEKEVQQLDELVLE